MQGSHANLYFTGSQDLKSLLSLKSLKTNILGCRDGYIISHYLQDNAEPAHENVALFYKFLFIPDL